MTRVVAAACLLRLGFGSGGVVGVDAPSRLEREPLRLVGVEVDTRDSIAPHSVTTPFLALTVHPKREYTARWKPFVAVSHG